MSYTYTANIKNENKINDEYEDVYDNDDKYDNDILTHSSLTYESVDCEESTSDRRQVSDYKYQLMSLILLQTSGSISSMISNLLYDIYNKVSCVQILIFFKIITNKLGHISGTIPIK